MVHLVLLVFAPKPKTLTPHPETLAPNPKTSGDGPAENSQIDPHQEARPHPVPSREEEVEVQRFAVQLSMPAVRTYMKPQNRTSNTT
jgi:hypothetical protein